MATANKFLEQPARGSLPGVWDTPVNGNMGIIDNSFGGSVSIALNNSPVVLSSAQYQCLFITFTGALSGNCTISFPAVGSKYTVQNLTTNTSAFQVILQAGGTLGVGCPWGEPFDVMTDTSGNVKFCDLGRIGSYWDYAGSSVPAWVSACTVPPYLNCDGTSFSSATYPILATILGGTTLPDAKGRVRGTLNQGSGRITSGSSTGGVDGNTNLAAGGAQTVTLSSQNVPDVPLSQTAHSHTGLFTATSTTEEYLRRTGVSAGAGGISVTVPSLTGGSGSMVSGSASITITAGSTSPTNFSILPPIYIGGITMVRAA